MTATALSSSTSVGATLLDGLNEAQRRAAGFGVDDDVPCGAIAPLLVVAGAGAGKTSTLAARVARLVLGGADPSRLLLLTFSRRAAVEMERRVGRTLHAVLGLAPTQPPPRLPWCGTFHSIGARLLRSIAERVGLDPSFTVDDRGDAEELMHLLRQRLALASATRRFPQKGTCLAIYSRTVNTRQPLAATIADSFPWCTDHVPALGRLFAAYVAEKQSQRVLDFDDLLVWWAEAMADAGCADAIRARFDHVLVDEYQDTNRVQAEIVRALRPDGRGLTVVGDDAQSIYSFRAADVRNILDFAAQFEPPAAVLTLEQNYRSTAPLLAASNAVIALAAERHVKQLWSERQASERPALVWVEDEAAEAAWVAERVLALRESGLALKSQAVLFRSSQHSNALELELRRRDIPFVKYGGLQFLEAAHVKDVLAVLRFAANPRGQRAALRALQLVPGIGPATADRLLAALADGGDPLTRLGDVAPASDVATPWAEFLALFAQLRAPASPWPGELGAVERWYVPMLDRLHEDPAPRAADVAHLVRLAAGYPSRERFLTELALDPPAATSDEAGVPSKDEDYLILSTIHSAKGQEWSAVSLLRVVDGCIPSDMATGNAAEVEEERRLLYVAMTRARHHLHLLVPQRFHVSRQAAFGDRHVYGAISRFLPRELHGLFDHVGSADAARHLGDARVIDGAATIDLGARVRALWS